MNLLVEEFKHEKKSVKLLCHKNHIRCVNNINALFKTFRCSTCDTFFSRTGNLEQHSGTGSEPVKHSYPKNVYELRKTLFEKSDAFNITYRDEQKLFKILAVFDFESICLKEDTYKETETTKWIGRHVPISAPVSSNLIQDAILLCNTDPHFLVSTFFIALEGTATQNKAHKKLKFIEVGKAITIKLCKILELLNQDTTEQKR